MASLAIDGSPATSAPLRRERDRFVAFAFTWADILFELDDEARIVYASGILETLIGRNVQELLGSVFYDLVLPDERRIARSLLASVRRCERSEEAVLGLIGPNGQPVITAFSGYRLLELEGHVFIGLRGKQPRQAGERAGCRDEGSGLLKSRAFVESVGQHLDAATAGKEQRLSLIRLLGAEKLQQQPTAMPERDLLREIGECLRSHSRNSDLAARVGPDRFGLLHGTETDIGKLKKQLLEVVAESDPQSKEVAIECASFEIDREALRTEQIAKGIVYVINRFRASDRGASELSRTSRSFTKLAEEAANAIDGLRGIISRGDFGLVFQPILDAHSGDIHHYEALARFPALRGATGEHIMLAEEIGIISEFDAGMLRKVFDRLGGPSAEDKSRIAVNISGQSVNSAAYTASLDRLLLENSWLQNRLMFEITESSRMDDLRAANSFVLKLRCAGYDVCLDDFGAGAANFQYLASLDVDIVKLDGAAVRCAQESAKGVASGRTLPRAFDRHGDGDGGQSGQPAMRPGMRGGLRARLPVRQTSRRHRLVLPRKLFRHDDPPGINRL